MFSRIRPLRLTSSLLLLLGLFLAGGFYLTHRPSGTPPDLGRIPELEVGDWIFRSGTSADSLVIRQLSGSEYSHIGMIIALHPVVQVIHATTDDDPTQLNQVLISSLSEFVQPALANHFAIARPRFLLASEKAQVAQHLLSQRGQAFLIQKRGLPHRYCTTVLAEAIQQVNIDFKPQWQQVDVAFYRGEYLFPNAFAEHSALEWIYHSPAQP